MNELDILKNDGVCVVPTDTLYGIVASAFSKTAVERMYDIKGRDATKPFIVLISDMSDLEKFDITLSQKQKNLLGEYWPGAVSAILECPSDAFSYIHRGVKSIAFRLPSDTYIIGLIQRVGPLVAPSANPQGQNPALTIDEAKKYFGSSVDMYVDAGLKNSQPSKIISLVGDEIKILRN